MAAGELPITEVRVKLTGDPHSKVRAFCSVTLADCFVIRDVKIIDGGRGAFIAMPSRKLTDKCDRCHHKNHLRAVFCNQCGVRLDPERASRDADGRVRLHADLAHPINSGCRIELHRAVLHAYDEELERSKQEGYVPPSFDDLDGGDDLFDEHYVLELQRRQAERQRQRGGDPGPEHAFEQA
ncbi:MAG: septation protein SpoVG family protein [Planctomycetota bacterium]